MYDLEEFAMNARCPGQDSRKLTAEVLICPQCRAEVEIFSDEVRVTCAKCGEVVRRKKMPSCADWCVAAKQCLGDGRWKSLKIETREESTDASKNNHKNR